MNKYQLNTNTVLDLTSQDEYLIEIDNNLELTLNIFQPVKVLFIEKSNNSLITINIENGEESKICVFNHLDVEVKNKTVINLNRAFGRVIYSNVSLCRNSLSYDIDIIHNNQSTYGEMINYSVIDDGGKLGIKASGIINESMHGSMSHQTTRVLTLTPNYSCNCEPILIINDNDVQASHANSIGQADDEQLYYLASRGLNTRESLKLISKSYLMPILQVLENGQLYDYLEGIIEHEISFDK